MYKSVRTVTLSLSALSIATFALLSSATAAAAPTDSTADDIPAHVRFAMQRDLGLMPGQIPQYLATERRMPDTERNARSALGAQYAGAWLERDRMGNYVPVIAVAGQAHASTVATLGARVRVVAHSLAQLETAHSRLDGMARLTAKGKSRPIDARIHSWHIDPMRNSVVMTIDPGAIDTAIDFVAASGADSRVVRFVESKSRPQLLQQANFDIRGGDRFNMPGSWCSIGFAVTLGTRNGFVTAGHCGTTGTAVTHPNGQAIGTIADSVYPGSDFAVVENTNPRGIPRPWVNAYAFGGNLVIRGSTPAAINAVICRSGTTTGARCGNLLSTGGTVNYGNGNITGLSFTSACGGRGDSGGSFATPEGQAQGVLSGGELTSGNDNCSSAAPRTFFQPLRPILANYPGLTLVVGP
ncbi:MAG: S1 family peptidase [Xanthomonadaceae bacterium]|nr:S1 family peptidase [Xanthomonadaceae bacterium]